MFAVLYKWKIKRGFEEQFKTTWAILTDEFVDQHGGLGSRLHRSGDYWLAYAMWPNKKSWATKKQIKDLGSMKLMDVSIEERFPPVELDIVLDKLVL